MKNLKLYLLLFVFLATFPAYAEDILKKEATATENITNTQEDEAVLSLPENEELPLLPEDNEFRQDGDALEPDEEISRPDCNSPEFHTKVINTVKDYLSSRTAVSTIAKREEALLLNHLQAFEKAEAENFSYKTDVNTADALIMLKINDNVPGSQITLCRQAGNLKKPLYVIIYPYMDKFRGIITNLNRFNTKNEEISFIYP